MSHVNNALFKRAQKDAESFDITGFNSAWRRLEYHPQLHVVFWAWLENNFFRLPLGIKSKTSAPVKHILHKLSKSVQMGEVLEVDLHHLNREAAIAVLWHFIASARNNDIIDFITGKGTHSAHRRPVLLKKLQFILSAAKCNFETTLFSVRVVCTSKMQQKLNTYLSEYAAAYAQSQKKHNISIMSPSKQHRPGHFKYEGQQRVLKDKLKKRQRRKKNGSFT